MIESTRSKAIKELLSGGRSKLIRQDMTTRALQILDLLQAAERAEDMNVPGLDFHELQGKRKGTYTVHVNGPWCVTFKWNGENATDVDLEQYH